MKKFLFALIAFCFVISVSCQPRSDIEKERTAMASEYVKAWNQGDLTLLDKLLATECVRHHVGISEDLIGIDAIKGYVTYTRTGFPDFHVILDELIIAKDYSIGRWTVTGTNTGPLGDSPPTGKKVKYSGVEITHIVNGKIVESWVYFNQAAMFTQLGYSIIPPEQ